MQIITGARQFSSSEQMLAHYAGVRKRLDTAQRPPVVTAVAPRLAPSRPISGALRLTPNIIDCTPPLCASAIAVEDWLQAFAEASGIGAEVWRTSTGPVQQDIRALAAVGAVRVDRAHPARVVADLGLPQVAYEKAFHQFPLYAAEIGAPMLRAARADLAKHIHQKVGERRLTMADIRACVAQTFGVSERDITSRCRQPAISLARQIYYVACRTLTDHSLPEIARHCGKRDHTTVLDGLALLSQRLASGDNHLFSQIADLERALGLSMRTISDKARTLAPLWAKRIRTGTRKSAS